MKVVGFAERSFTARDTGAVVDGMNIYCTYPSTHVTGVAVERVFVSSRLLGNIGYYPSLDDDIEFSYNKYGRIIGISVN